MLMVIHSNKLGVSPNYKKLTVHLGWRNMDFSKYTLNGTTFNGLGIEFNPGIVRVKAMSGKLINDLALVDTLVYGTQLIESYKRKVNAVSLGLGNNRNYFDLILTKAKDEFDESIEAIYTSEVDTRPKENLMLGTRFQISLFNRLTINADVAGSGLSADNQVGRFNITQNEYEIADAFLKHNSTTKFGYAGTIKFNYAYKKI